MKNEMRPETKIILASAAGFFAIIIMSVLFFIDDIPIFSNMVLLGMMVLFVPYFLFSLFQFKKIKKYEEQFPAFLRDLSESQRAGLGVVEAIKLAADSDYGYLTHEIKKMKTQLSWNIPLEKVLYNFSKRMSRSKLIVRSLLVIDQANKSGGNIVETMDSLADNIESIRDVQKEKSVLLNQQVVMMYAIFFIFLGITIALTSFLLPLINSQSSSGGLSFGADSNPNPCFKCLQDSSDAACNVCSVYFGVSSAFGFGEKEQAAAYYKSLFFIMIIVQGIFSGLIAGQIGSDSVLAGVKHSLIMTLSGFFTFIMLTRLAIL